MTCRAYAKINIGLLILGRRPDGYHDLQTVFHRINLFDQITLEPSESTITVESNEPAAPGDETNLCFRAADALRRFLGHEAGVRISLAKSIPVGAGLGGGSSDAACVLRHLPRLWGRPLDDAALSELALGLGSDVAYFLQSGSAIARGRGEVLKYFTLELPYAILVCTPAIHVSTAWAYGRIDVKSRPRQVDLESLVVAGMKDPSHLAELENDFEDVVFEAYPDIRLIRDTMRTAGAAISLRSGSGSSVFGLFERMGTAREVAALLARRGHRVSLTEPGFRPA